MSQEWNLEACLSFVNKVFVREQASEYVSILTKISTKEEVYLKETPRGWILPKPLFTQRYIESLGTVDVIVGVTGEEFLHGKFFNAATTLKELKDSFGFKAPLFPEDLKIFENMLHDNTILEGQIISIKSQDKIFSGVNGLPLAMGCSEGRNVVQFKPNWEILMTHLRENVLKGYMTQKFWEDF